MNNSFVQLMTLVYLARDNHICLGLKKRGFGAHYYNGFGGKVETGETITEAAVREVYEESGVQVLLEDLEQVADVTFVYTDKTLHVPTFFVRKWQGEPVETEEMQPVWFTVDAVPYDQMWEDDRHWMPRVWDGEKLKGTVWFKDDGTSVEKMQWEVVDHFEESI